VHKILLVKLLHCSTTRNKLRELALKRIINPNAKTIKIEATTTTTNEMKQFHSLTEKAKFLQSR